MKNKIVLSVVMHLFVLIGLFALPSIGVSDDTAHGISVANQQIVGVQERDARIDGLAQKIEALEQNQSEEKHPLTRKIFIAGIILIIGVVFFALLKIGLKKFEEMISEKEVIRESDQTLRFKTIVRLFHWAGSIAIICTILYMILEDFGVNVAPLLAGAGIVGLAFGFGGQYLIRDIINGIFILLEGQYGVNDVVKIGEYAGVVEIINLRITVLRDGEGRVIIIPNGEIKTVVNLSKDYSRAVLTIGVAYKENVDRVMDLIIRIGKEIRGDSYFGKLILEDLEMQGIDDLADSQVSIRFRVKTLPSKQFEVARELRRRIKNRFDDLGIEIPFPHRTIYYGNKQAS